MKNDNKVSSTMKDSELDIFTQHPLTDEQCEEFLRFNRHSCYIALCLPLLA